VIGDKSSVHFASGVVTPTTGVQPEPIGSSQAFVSFAILSLDPIFMPSLLCLSVGATRDGRIDVAIRW
jgi:hypothetical protein